MLAIWYSVSEILNEKPFKTQGKKRKFTTLFQLRVIINLLQRWKYLLITVYRLELTNHWWLLLYGFYGERQIKSLVLAK